MYVSKSLGTDPSMNGITPEQPVDYLIIGHVTQDLGHDGYSIGGSVAYSGLTAKAIGLNVGIITACSPHLALEPLDGLDKVVVTSRQTTTFRNEQTASGRKQWVLDLAVPLKRDHIPTIWKNSRIIHLAPVANEVDHEIIDEFDKGFICVTAQGWLRLIENGGAVKRTTWKAAKSVLEHVTAAVIGIEDVEHDETMIEEFAHYARILVITEGANGARVYWNGDLRRFNAPPRQEVDSTGAGDIFAGAFFIRLNQTGDPWASARYATILAANSVTRHGLASVPTPIEAHAAQVEILERL